MANGRNAFRFNQPCPQEDHSLSSYNKDNDNFEDDAVQVKNKEHHSDPPSEVAHPGQMFLIRVKKDKGGTNINLIKGV